VRPMCRASCDDLIPRPWSSDTSGFEVPATDTAVYELMGWLHTEPLPLGDLSRIIRLEPGLAASVLRAAAEEQLARVSSLSAAIVVLGFAGLQRLALKVPLLNERERRHRRMLQLVMRSRRAAHISETLAYECGWPQAESAYIAGLLLDLGRLRHLWRATQVGWAWSENDREPESLPAEELTRVWRFPPAVVAAIACREEPDEASDYRLLARLVALAAVSSADPILLQAGAGGGSMLRATELVKQHLPLLPLSRQLAVAELLITEFKRSPGGRSSPSPAVDRTGRAHG
jgi:hypothetical protein